MTVWAVRPNPPNPPSLRACILGMKTRHIHGGCVVVFSDMLVVYPCVCLQQFCDHSSRAILCGQFFLFSCRASYMYVVVIFARRVGTISGLDWTGLTQNAFVRPFQCRTEAIRLFIR